MSFTNTPADTAPTDDELPTLTDQQLCQNAMDCMHAVRDLDSIQAPASLLRDMAEAQLEDQRRPRHAIPQRSYQAEDHVNCEYLQERLNRAEDHIAVLENDLSSAITDLAAAEKHIEKLTQASKEMCAYYMALHDQMP
jgi:chromosome segregation ATPase